MPPPAYTASEPGWAADEVAPAQGTAPRPDALLPGTRLEEFEIERVIGSSGFGLVYLANDESFERRVAIKEYLPDTLAVRGEDGMQVLLRAASHADAFERGRRAFVDEAQLLARCDHPSLVHVLRQWEANGTVYRAMPFYPGHSLLALRQALAAPPDEASLRGLLDGLLDALAALHDAGGLHREIAPGKILLLPDDRPVLMGPSAERRAIVGDRARALMALLAPSFAPLEQTAPSPERPLGPWTDLYALAAVVRYCLGGELPPPTSLYAPAPREGMAALAHRVCQAHPQLHFSPSFLAAIDAALAPRPEDRPQDVAEFRSLLDNHPPAWGERAEPEESRLVAPLDEDEPAQERTLGPFYSAAPAASESAERPDTAAQTSPPAKQSVAGASTASLPGRPAEASAAPAAATTTARPAAQPDAPPDTPPDTPPAAAKYVSTATATAASALPPASSPVPPATASASTSAPEPLLQPAQRSEPAVPVEPPRAAVPASGFRQPAAADTPRRKEPQLEQPPGFSPPPRAAAAPRMPPPLRDERPLAADPAVSAFIERRRRARRRLGWFGAVLMLAATGAGIWVLDQQRLSTDEQTAFAHAARQDGLTANLPAVPQAAETTPANAPAAGPAGTSALPQAPTAAIPAPGADPSATAAAAAVDIAPPQAPPADTPTAAAGTEAAPGTAVAPPVSMAEPLEEEIETEMAEPPGAVSPPPKTAAARSDAPTRRSSAPARTNVNPPARTVAAASPAAPARITNPREACGNRTQFALYRCMQMQCDKVQWIQHPLCKRLRIRDEVD